jgi:hypothetical protein
MKKRRVFWAIIRAGEVLYTEREDKAGKIEAEARSLAKTWGKAEGLRYRVLKLVESAK